MYQRFAMCVARLRASPRLAGDPEDESDDDANDLIGDQKQNRCQRHHDEHHDGGDQRLAPRRPGDLVGLGAHLLEELERADLRHELRDFK